MVKPATSQVLAAKPATAAGAMRHILSWLPRALRPGCWGMGLRPMSTSPARVPPAIAPTAPCAPTPGHVAQAAPAPCGPRPPARELRPVAAPAAPAPAPAPPRPEKQTAEGAATSSTAQPAPAPAARNAEAWQAIAAHLQATVKPRRAAPAEAGPCAEACEGAGGARAGAAKQEPPPW